jgi:phage terminase Nu1 subunit (DNA packaging protein)
MLVALSIISECLGVSREHVTRLANKGVIPKSIDGKYDLVPSVRGYIESLRARTDSASVSLTKEKTLLVKRQRERLELELARAREELVSVDLVNETWEKIIYACRSRLLVIPTKLAPLVFAAKTIPEVKEVIQDAIYEALRELARTEVVDTDVESTSKSKRKRVGRRKEQDQSQE